MIQALAVENAIQPGALLVAMKDGAYVNQAALQQVRFFFPQLLDVTCFSHKIDNVGKHFEFRVIKQGRHQTQSYVNGFHTERV